MASSTGLCLITVLCCANVAAAAPSITASACMESYATASEGASADQKCAAMSGFAACVVKIRSSDVLRGVAEQLLRSNENALAKCEDSAAFPQPSIKVVDRNVRIVSDKDVIFQRFRKDQVGIVELKERVDGQGESIAALRQETDGRASKLNASVDGLSQRMQPLQKHVDEQQAAFAAMSGTVKAAFVKQDAKLQGIVTKSKSARDPLTAEQTYWLAVDKPLLPTDSPTSSVSALGVGMAPYYHPNFPSLFTCTYTDAATKKTIKTPGRTDAVDYAAAGTAYHITCDTPEFVKGKTQYKLSITYEDADGARAIPFKGVAGRDVVTFDMVWHRVRFVGQAVLVDVAGFITGGPQYVCSFEQGKVKKTLPASFVQDKAAKAQVLSCGKQPSGFKAEGVHAAVTFKVFSAGVSPKYAVGVPESDVILLPTCLNGVQDGSESDVDCGGACTAKCESTKKCKKDDDCVFGSCGDGGKCGGFNGGAPETAGDSCKQILRDYPKSKNGKYWVRGQKQILKHAVVVFCWMEAREGGGWTLIMKNWYSGHKAGPWNSFGTGSPRTCDVLGIRGCPYKLHDDIIKAVIGQGTTATKFDVMGDQAGLNTHYSGVNREWTLMTDYTAVWSFIRYTPMRESSSKARFRSYLMPTNFDGKSNVGDGKVNWEAQLNCGGKGGSGINCYGIRSYTKGYNANSRGGFGCKANPSRGRWSGNPHWYMFNTNHDTYVYICNGAQHSSSFNMNPRWWIRSGAGMEE